MITTFEAKYNSKCQECPEGIEPGDEVVYAGSTVVHVQCASESAVAEEKLEPGSVCRKCFEVRSVNGACACDPE